MPNLAANLSTLFREVPFLERFEAAARFGFKGVEFLRPYEYPAEALAAALRDSGQTVALFNSPPGDSEKGERGLAALPGREADFDMTLAQAHEYAKIIRPRCLHLMAGIPPADATPAACRDVFCRNVRKAARTMADIGVNVLIEPINTRDIPGYFLNRQDQALAILDEVAEPNAGLQMDLYHCQIVEGDVATKIRRNASHIRHFQIAGVPDRHEPDSGELHYPFLFALIDELGYNGWVGCEYHPAGPTVEGLGWASPYGIGAPSNVT